MTVETKTNNLEMEKSQESHDAPSDVKAYETALKDTAVSTVAVAQDNSKMQNLMVGVVGALVIMAGIQVFQTQQLMAAVSSGSIKASGQAQERGSGIGLQSQVGGCG